MFQRLVFAVTTASSTWDIIIMNDKFERGGQLKLLSDSLILLIRIGDRSSKKFLNKHTTIVYSPGILGFEMEKKNI